VQRSLTFTEFDSSLLKKLYDRKNALVAADMLNDQLVPFFEQHDLRLLKVLTDRGTEYCRVRDQHEYQLYLAIEDIDHTKTKAKSPQTNGVCERFHRTIQDEFYAVAFRKKVYRSIQELQNDLDRWITYYNQDRTHTGKYCFGKTPMKTFNDTIHLAREKMLETLKINLLVIQCQRITHNLQFIQVTNTIDKFIFSFGLKREFWQ